MKTTNSKCKVFVQAKQSFEANNLKAVWRYVSLNEGLYIIYSYNWYPLFVYDKAQDKWFENSEKYSVSTSKQRGQCHPQVETILKTLEEIQDFISIKRSNKLVA